VEIITMVKVPQQNFKFRMFGQISPLSKQSNRFINFISKVVTT